MNETVKTTDMGKRIGAITGEVPLMIRLKMRHNHKAQEQRVWENMLSVSGNCRM